MRARRLRWGQVTPELAQGLMSSSCMSQTGQDPRALVKRGSLPLHSETKQIFPEHLPRARNWANKQQKRRFSGILILFVCLFVWGDPDSCFHPLVSCTGSGGWKAPLQLAQSQGSPESLLQRLCLFSGCMAATCLRRDSRWGGLYGFCCQHPRSQTLVPGAAGEGETEGPPNTLIAPNECHSPSICQCFFISSVWPGLPANDMKYDWRGGEGKGEGMGKRKGSKDLAAALSVVYRKV